MNKLVLRNHLIFFFPIFFSCVSLGCVVSQIASVSVRRLTLHQVVLLQIELQDGVFDGGEDEADVLRVGGAGEMGVNDLIAVWVQVHEHLQDKLAACLGVPLRTCGAANGGALVTNLKLELDSYTFNQTQTPILHSSLKITKNACVS